MLNFDPHQLVLIAALSGGIIATSLSKKPWKELAGVFFSSVSVAIFMGPALGELGNWIFQTTLLTQPVLAVAGALFIALGGYPIASKVIMWWEHVPLSDVLSSILRSMNRGKDKMKDEL